MPQKEREEEIQARRVVERTLGVELTHADTNGGVDYRFTTSNGRSAAAEVTTVTDGNLKGTLKEWVNQRQGEYEARSLVSSWHLIVDETRVTLKDINQALEPALSQLEQAGLDRYYEWSALELVMEHPELRPALQTMVDRGVEIARTFPTKDSDLQRMLVDLMGGGSASGSDASLDLIETELASKPDNVQKLVDARVNEAHLFVWLDSQTPGEISRPFTGGRAAEYDHFGLPSRPPEIGDAIDALWIVHRGTGVGWLWRRGDEWTGVDGSPSPSAT